jgi:hypothetical protein
MTEKANREMRVNIKGIVLDIEVRVQEYSCQKIQKYPIRQFKA